MSYNTKIHQRNKKCSETFIEKAKNIHGDKYDYSKFVYSKAIEKSIIVCKIHGEFEQTPHTHLNGGGCQKCKAVKVGKNNSQTKESFIEKANKKFNKSYDYSKIKFVNNTTSIEITCNKHGSFWQQPAHHLQSTGCPRCIYDNVTGMYNLTNAERFKEEWLSIPAKFYFIECYNDNELFQKIGITVKEKIKYRFGRLPYKYNILNIIETNLYEVIKLEHELLKKYKMFKYIPLIKFKGFTECLQLTPQDKLHMEKLKQCQEVQK